MAGNNKQNDQPGSYVIDELFVEFDRRTPEQIEELRGRQNPALRFMLWLWDSHKKDNEEPEK